jgi:DNA topoisomerase-1
MAALTLVPPPHELARRARLCYTCDDEDGLRRVCRGRVVIYEDSRGRVVRDPKLLARIRALAIPPAWTDVWICRRSRGHIQATGRDVRGRKQYIYHPDWHAHTGRTKFSKLPAFGQSLARLRARVRRDLALSGLPAQKVIAAVIALLDGTLIRVGNEEYARSNGSYGLTTLRNRHADVRGQVIRLRFKGKSGKLRQVDFYDQRLARIVKRCQELPGQQLFQYADDDGKLRRVESADVNRYLRSVTGHAFSAKDFRTWKATVLMLERLSKAAVEPLSATEARRQLMIAFRETADALGNTVTVCRKYYVHPQIVDLFLAGRLRTACGPADARSTSGLRLYERLLLKILSSRALKKRTSTSH